MRQSGQQKGAQSQLLRREQGDCPGSSGQADVMAIERYVQKEMRRARIPGLVLGIVQGNQVHLRGFGRADETGRPFTPQTPFLIGSIAKNSFQNEGRWR